MRKIYVFAIILIIIIMIIGVINYEVIIEPIIEKVNIQLYGEPISEDGTINNRYFGINSENEEADKTTRGLNKAIEYASKKNIKQIKLEYGKYKVNGIGKKYIAKGIILKSNISLDLNNSIISQEKNSSERYAIFNVYGAENVSVFNGTIEGDREIHDYDTIKSTHEWGYGIEINGSNNVQIFNLKIENLIGDGILITENRMDKNGKISENIKIYDNQISKCRRQGISVICANHLEIYNNDISKINGTSPGSGIDLEPDNNKQVVKNIKIYNNKIYDVTAQKAIISYNGVTDVEIFENELNGNVKINGLDGIFKVIQNKFTNGKVIYDPSNTNIIIDNN